MHKSGLACLLAATLCGCASTRSVVSAKMADIIPEWAGGLPADAPPRPGEPGYEKYMQDLNAQLAAPKGDQAKEGKSAADGKTADKPSGK
jgi:hypothetical protein